MSEETNTMVVKLKQYQDDFLFSECRFPCLVAGWGTGKSMCGILKGLSLSEKYKNNRGVIFRREFTDLANSTMKDFELYTGMKVSEYKKFVKLPNGSEIYFLHMKELDVLKNMNIGWFLLEQAEELSSAEQFDYLDGRLRLQQAKLRQGMVIANAADKTHWIYKYWFDNPQADERFQVWQATSFDNRDNLPEDTIRSWELLGERNPAVYRRFVLNEWGVSGADFTLIPYDILERAKLKTTMRPYTKRIISVDPSQGGDECVIMVLENYKIVDMQILQGNEYRDTMKVVGHIAIMSNKHKIDKIAVDSIGIGAGIADRLREMGKEVFYIQSAEKSKSQGYGNKRAEMYGVVAEMVRDGEIPYPADEETARQLCSVQYQVMGSSGLIQIEKKDEIKKRIGKSPDRADCFVYGVFHLRDVPDENPKPSDYGYHGGYEQNVKAGSFMGE